MRVGETETHGRTWTDTEQGRIASANCNFRAVNRGKKAEEKTATDSENVWIPFWILFLKNQLKSAKIKNPFFFINH